MNMVKKLACGIMCLAAMSAVVDAQAAAPKVKVAGDTITVTIPDGTASGTNRLVLCWGASDAGSEFVDWGNSLILSENVTSTGGVWTVSAAAKGIAANSALRAFIGIPYKVVNYIESTTGTAGTGGAASYKTLAINSGIAAKTGLHVKTKMRWLTLADTEFCGGRKAANDSTRMFSVHTYQNKWFLGYDGVTANTEPCSKDVDYEVESKLYLGSQTMSVDGSQIYSLSGDTAVDTTGPVAIFASYYPANEPTPIASVSHARCYYLKMWENGNTTDNPEGDLVRDFIPVKDAEGHGALYDKITKKTFPSVYSGPEPVEYLAVGNETGDVVYSMDIVSPLMVAGFSSLYVQDGLVACWDGIENAGAGIHDSSAIVWKDLVAGYEFSLNDVTVEADRMTFAGTTSSYGTLSAADTESTFVAAKSGTMEIVYVCRSSSLQVLLQSTASSGLAFGLYNASSIIPHAASSVDNKPLIQFSSGTATNSVSVRFTSGGPVSAIANGESKTLSGGNYWGSPGTTTIIGNRDSKASPFSGSIYCIRLYNRQLTDEEVAANHALDVKRFQEGNHFDDALEISGEPDELGSPSPAYGKRSGLSAGDTVAVSCGATPTINDGKAYACTGWELYDINGDVVSIGNETSFTYTHPTPAEYRKLEWQWTELLTILPIPDQVNESFDPCCPELTVSNRIDGTTWTVGGDTASPYFDVEYTNNLGVGTATVTVSGKGELSGAHCVGHYNITATKLEDNNISTTDTSARRLTVGGKSVYAFTDTSSAKVVTAKRGIVLEDCLLVGGGGGGGHGRAGGGGGGGVTNVTDIVGAYIDRDDTFTLAVGAGGAGGSSDNVKGGNGGETSLRFGLFDASIRGGGGGGSWSSTAGANGASGGGGTQTGAGGAGIDGMGFAGANGGGGNSAASGGGGGAGHAGYAADTISKIAGNGGEGIASSITGTEVYYGGGGGGGGGANGLWGGLGL